MSKLDKPTGATRQLAAVGTGYSGSSLDKVDKIRDVAERGVTKVEGIEVLAPPEVQFVAAQALEEVKETGEAIDGASKKVAAESRIKAALNCGLEQTPDRHSATSQDGSNPRRGGQVDSAVLGR